MNRSKKSGVRKKTKVGAKFNNIPAIIKNEVKNRTDPLIETVLKKEDLKLSLKDNHFNYLAGIDTKWSRRDFYFSQNIIVLYPFRASERFVFYSNWF